MDNKGAGVALDAKSLGLIGFMGGLGGAINAWLCYAKLPVPSGYENFSWFIIPAGASHGALLAVSSTGLTGLLWDRGWPLRWLGFPIIGWISGWLAYSPIQLYLAFSGLPFSPSPRSMADILDAFVWPFQNGMDLKTLWIPYAFFGLVGLAYSFLSTICRHFSAKQLLIHLTIGIVSGCLGSLWWWILFQPWYFSLLHGTIWGSLVGVGVWKSQQLPSRSN